MSTSPRRPDLIELGPQALTALANPGFVKRAIKEVGEGLLPEIEEAADGTVVARFADGQRTTLPPGRSLREANCTCPASGMCRHRVTLVLAYQAWAATNAAGDGSPATPAETSAWDPADFDDAALAAGLPPATLELAARLAAARPVIHVSGWQADAPTPGARLPMCSVRFFSRRSIVHARCDCRKGSACEHVALAVWAFRQARQSHPGELQATVELAPIAMPDGERKGRFFGAEQATPLPALDALLLQLWLDGSSQPPAALEPRFAALRSGLVDSNWCWVVESIDEIRQLLSAQQLRSSSFDPERLLDALAELPARLLAARHAEGATLRELPARLPAAQILGLGVKGEVALDHLRLVSLGMECWRGDETEGVRIAFADPDTQTVTVLVRNWPLAGDAAGGGLLARRIAGHSVAKLACGQVVTKGARRRANGLIEIAAGVRQTSVLSLSPRSWEALDTPLRQPGGSALTAHLQQAHPDFVRPRQAIEHMHVLPIARVLDWGWDAASQTLHGRVSSSGADVADPDAADEVQLSVPHQAVAPGAVDAMARALQGEWGALTAVAGMARLESGRLHLRPLSVLTEQRAVVLQAEQSNPQSLPMREVACEPSALAALVGNTRSMLVSWLRQGLRHQGEGALARGRAQAELLSQAGLALAGEHLRSCIDDIRGEDRSALPTQLARIILLLQGIQRGAVPENKNARV